MEMKVVNINDEQDNSWTTVCQLDQLPENFGQCVLVNGKQIAIFRLSNNDEIYAIDNFDPFSKASVLSRGIVGDLRGTPVVASPVYKQHFDLATGQCLEDDAVSVATYLVRCLSGAVQLNTDLNIQ